MFLLFTVPVLLWTGLSAYYLRKRIEKRMNETGIPEAVVWKNTVAWMPYVFGLFGGCIWGFALVLIGMGAFNDGHGIGCDSVTGLLGVGAFFSYVLLYQHPLYIFTLRYLYVFPFYGWGMEVRRYELKRLSVTVQREKGVMETCLFFEGDEEVAAITKERGMDWMNFCRLVEEWACARAHRQAIGRVMDLLRRGKRPVLTYVDKKG